MYQAVHSVTLWTVVTLALNMCWVCTEAVHSVALWKRVTSPLWTYVALDQCKLWTPFGHFCPYFHTPYTLLCPKDDFTFTFPRGLIWKIDNPSTTLSLAPGKIDNPYKGAESAGCQKVPILPGATRSCASKKSNLCCISKSFRKRSASAP